MTPRLYECTVKYPGPGSHAPDPQILLFTSIVGSQCYQLCMTCSYHSNVSVSTLAIKMLSHLAVHALTGELAIVLMRIFKSPFSP